MDTKRPSGAIAATLAAALTFAVLVSAPASASTVLDNGCLVVTNPTPANHTVCHDMTFDGLGDQLNDANLDYADFTGSTITNMLFGYTSSHRHLILDDVTYASGTPLSGAQAPGSIASAVNAVLGVGGGVAVGSSSPPQWVYANNPNGYLNDEWVWPSPPTEFGAGGNFEGAVFNGYVSGDFTGANLTNAVFNGTVGGSSFENAILDGASLGTSDNEAGGGNSLEGASVDGLTIWASNLGAYNLRGLDMRQVNLPITTKVGGSRLVDTVWDDLDVAISDLGGTDVAGASFKDVTFTQGPVDFALGGIAHDVDLSGVSVEAASGNEGDALFRMSGVDALRANFTNADLPYAEFMGSNLTSADFTNAKIGYGEDNLDLSFYGPFSGAHLGYTTLDGAMVAASAAMHWGVSARDTQFLLFNQGSAYMWFQNSDLTGASFTHAPGAYGETKMNGSRFRDSTLDDVTFETALEGVEIIDSSAIKASFNTDQARPMGGMWVVGSDLSDSRWPAPANDPGDPAKWLYGLKVWNTNLEGSDLDPDDLTVVRDDPWTDETVDYSATAAWANEDDQSPFTADGGYWWGSKIEQCDIPTGSTFPLGMTQVNCDVAFDAEVNPSPTTWSSMPFSLDLAGTSGEHVFPVSWFNEPGTLPQGEPQADWTRADLAGVPESAGGAPGFPDMSAYQRPPEMFSTDTDQVTFGNNPVSFEVTVQAAPGLTVSASTSAVAGRDLPTDAFAFTTVGFPVPKLTVTGLPDGLEMCGVTTDSDTSQSSATLCGTPAEGTGGAYEVTVAASNSLGVATEQFSMWVSEPTVIIQPDRIAGLGQHVDVWCERVTPGSTVELTVGEGDPHDTVAGVDGVTPVMSVLPAQPLEPGNMETWVTCVDVETGASGTSTITVSLDPPVEVVPAETPDPEPEGLATTGPADVAWLVLAAVLLLGSGAAGLRYRRL